MNCIMGVWGTAVFETCHKSDTFLTQPGGHRIVANIEFHRNTYIYTPDSPTETITVNPIASPQIDACLGMLCGKSAVAFYESVAQICEANLGKTYYIYRQPECAILRMGKHFDNSCRKIMTSAFAYYAEHTMSVLRISNESACIVRISLRQINRECPNMLYIQTDNTYTRVNYAARESDTTSIDHCYIGTKPTPKIMAGVSKSLSRVYDANCERLIYVFSMDQSGALSHVHEPHLRMLQGRFISATDVEVHIASKYELANESNIRYDDDGGCDSEDY